MGFLLKKGEGVFPMVWCVGWRVKKEKDRRNLK